ncbi:RAI1 like PD-XK nuclease-domain-containing protein [Multifurca ochricompacta]|uniref:Decapping nuclease n=1 Tax=Multifurca ochricompacta TaxID=376703 RepID=A0AAD4M698_9AGAM|nr:RAI1 like PD-XK nuclease-domain-containing protein [Multifurca ochricompacta]
MTSSTSRKRTTADRNERVVHKHLRLGAPPTPRLHAVVSLSYPSTAQPASRSVPFQRPLPLISFSYNKNRELEFSDAAIRYYVEPPPGADLGYAYERWVHRPEEKGRLDGLLRAISEIRRRGTGDPVIGVISWRGVMTKILTAPYEDRDGWELNVMVENGTLYLEEFISDARLEEKDNMTPRQRIQTYYGYAFESWCTASQPDAPSGWGGDVDTNVQWCNVVKTKLGDVRIIIGGEVDCVRGILNDTMVELKTSMNISGHRDEARFEKKLLKFYFQSFLLGVPEIVVGFRTPGGQLKTMQSFKTLEIPRMVRGKPNAWDARICLTWGEDFLTWIKHTIILGGNASGSVWRVKFTPCTGVELTLLCEDERREVEAGEDRVGFLPQWYWKEMQECSGEPGNTSRIDSESGRQSAPTASSSLPTGWQI